MSFVILGEKARENFGLREKYTYNLRAEYKAYIDTLEYDMMACVYSNVANECVVTNTFDLLLTESQIEACLGSEKYNELESAIIHFCQVHKCAVSISRGNTSIGVTIDMKLPFNITYN